MSNRGKKIFLALSIIVPFVIYCVYYYGIMIKNAPFRFSEFESLTFNYGTGDSLINRYDSHTGSFQYVNNRDSVVHKKVKLNKDDLLYLHRKAVQLGFWDYPAVIGDPHGPNPHFLLEMHYKRKTKSVLFDLGYQQDIRLHDAAKSMMDEVTKTLNDAESRLKN